MNTEYLKIGDITAKLYRGENAEETILAVHGFGGNKESGAIAGLAERVCGRGYNVLAIDLPAHGERDDFSQLSVERCIDDILSAEEYIKSALTQRVSAFATSFGAFCMLLRRERFPHCYRRTVLRVPAVNMADSLLSAAALFDRDFTLEKARREGFKLTMAKIYELPFAFYEQLREHNALRSCEAWNREDILVLAAELDELVSPVDTQEFLRLNPAVKSCIIKGAGHRMSQEGALEKALEEAVNFLA
ncbi:MAG: alpha/beta hydrolase [Oscillospiraceae bacterium]